MAPKAASLWEKPDFLVDVVCALYEVADLTPETKQMVEGFLRGEGHEISWDAIRQHVQKLRRNRDTNALSRGNSVTPTKAAAGGKKKAATKRAKQELTPADDDDDDEMKVLKREVDDDVDEVEVKTPKKKRVKREIKKEPSPVDGEAADDEANSGEV